MIPGLGEPTERCGEVSYVYKCVSCGDIHPLPYQCSRISCSICYTYWASRAAARVSDMFHGVASAVFDALDLAKSTLSTDFGKMQYRLKNPRHIVVSPPAETYDLFRNYDTAKKQFRALLKSQLYRLLGGAFVFHPYRVRADLKRQIASLLDTGEYNGKWDIIHKDALNLGSWKDYVTFSPHFHVMAYGSVPRSDVFHRVTGGWVYYNVGSRPLKIYKNEKGELVDEIQKTFAYLLTHCSVVVNPDTGRVRDCVTYFGIMARRALIRCIDHGNFVVRRVYVSDIHCEKCGGKMILCDSLTENPVIGFDGSYYERKERVIFHKFILKDMSFLEVT